jgi:hypothetical protein
MNDAERQMNMSYRYRYLVAIGLTILLGLSSRRFSASESWVHLYVGDVLWTAMFYWIFRWLFISRPLAFSLVLAIGWSFAIEISQLYHRPWLDSIRRTTLGGLVLGFGFLWSDLLCYSLGALLALLLDRVWLNARLPK